MILLKVVKKRSFTLSLGNTLFEKPRGGGGQTDPPNPSPPPACLGLKCRVPVYPLLYI